MKRKKSSVKKHLSESQRIAQVRNSNKGRICFIQGTIQYLLTSANVGLTEKEQEVLREIDVSCKQIITNWNIG